MPLKEGVLSKVICVTLCFLFASCGGSIPSDQAAVALNQTQSQSAGAASSKAPLDPKIENYITFDFLGGVFRKSIELENMILDGAGEPATSVGKLSANVLPPQTTSAVTAETTGGQKPFVIDTSYSFVGKNGSGKLVISASGSGTDEYTNSDVSQKIQHFDPLKLHFLFFNYAFNNKCLGEVHMDGEIVCDISGKYDTAARKFLGNAHCANGPVDQPQTILYITESANYDVVIDADLIINGNPFNYGSYKNSGTISIDGIEKKIEELITGGYSCS